MKWLTLSTEQFEPIPDIQFSLKKPLFAASVVLKFSREASAVRGFAALEARVPLKGLMKYEVEALSAIGRVFGFSIVRESDVGGGSARETRVISDESGRLEIDGAKVDVVNNSPTSILAHVLALPAFVQTHSSEDESGAYAGHLMVGRRVQALRLERKGPAANALARSKATFFVETYEGKLMTVAHALDEKEFEALPWATRKAFEFDYNVETKQLVAARFTIPIFGTIEIKA